jgi:hypothetical protein
MKTDFEKIQEAYEFSVVTGNDKFVEKASNKITGLLLETINAECVRLSEQTGKPTEALVNRVKAEIIKLLQ